MKIILLNGSPRKNGATSAVLTSLWRCLTTHNNIKAELIHIADVDMAFCKGCSVCFKTGECVIQDGAEELSQKIAKCDGIIIGSPTYESNVSGQLKTFFDRGHLVMEQLLYKKIGMTVAVGQNYGIKNASKVMQNLLCYSGAQVSDNIRLKLPLAHQYQLTAGTEKRLAKAADKFYAMLQGKKSNPLNKFTNQVAYHIGIKPFVLAQGETYAGVVRHWAHNKR